MEDNPVKSGPTTPAEGSRNLRPPDSEPNAATGTNTAGNGAICSCGATTFTFKNGKKRCAKGHVLVGNDEASITGQHGAEFRREHSAELDAMADRFARDAGYASLEAAPLAFQIAAQSLARTSKVADLAYWKMLEAGGPLSESGKPRRAYIIFKDTNSDLARDVKGAMSEVVAARPPGSGNPLVAEFQTQSTDDLIALSESLIAEYREMKAQDTERKAAAALPVGRSQPVPPSCDTRNNSGAALSRNSASSPTAPKAAAAVRTGEPRLTPTPDSASPTAEPSPAPRPVLASSGRASRESVTVHDDPHARFRNV